MTKARLLAFCLGLVSAIFLGSCAEPTASPSAARSSYGSAPVERPGLATHWGETRTSRVTATSFRRAHPSRPLATAAIYYNDAAGIRAMVAALSPRRTPPLLRGDAGSLLTVEVRDGNNRLLPGLTVGERWFVVGEQGRRYVIVLHNRSEFRLKRCFPRTGSMCWTEGPLLRASAATSSRRMAQSAWTVSGRARKRSRLFVSAV